MLILKNIYRNKIIFILIIFHILLILLSFFLFYPAYAGSRDLGITCPSSASAVSTEIAPARSGRLWIAFFNSSFLDIRIAKINSGTPNLTDSNSVILKAGLNVADSTPGTYKGRWVCMSNTTSIAILGVSETWSP